MTLSLTGRIFYSAEHANVTCGIKNRYGQVVDPEIKIVSKQQYCVKIKENDTDNKCGVFYCYQIWHYCDINYSTEY